MPLLRTIHYTGEIKYICPDKDAIQLQDQLQEVKFITQVATLSMKEQTKKQYDEKTKPILFKEKDMVLVRNFNKRKLRPKYTGPYEVVTAKESNISELRGEAVRQYYYKDVKPYLSSFIRTVTIGLILAFIPLAKSQFVTEIKNASEIIFLQEGHILNKVDECMLLTSINFQTIRAKYQALHELSLPQPYTEKFQSEYSDYHQFMLESRKRHDEKLSDLESSSDSDLLNPNLKSLPILRPKRAILPIGSTFLKWLYGTPDHNEANLL